MRWLGWVLAGLGLVAFGVIGWSWSADRAEERFEDEVDRLRAAGAPVELVQLDAPPIPDEENAAVLLLEARHHYEADETEWPFFELHRLRKSIEGRAEIPEEERDRLWAVVEKWIDSIEPYRALFRRAAARPRCRFELEWAGVSPPFLESIGFLSDAIGVLEWTIRVGLRRGLPARDLVDDCQAAWRISTFIPSWSLGNCHVRWREQMRLTGAIELLAQAGAGAALRTRMERLLSDAENPVLWVAALDSERIALIGVVRRLATRTGVEGLDHVFGRGDPFLDSRKPGRWERLVSRPQLFRDGLASLAWLSRSIDWIREDPRSALERLGELPRPEGDGGSFRGFLGPFETNVILALRNRRAFLTRIRATRLGLAALAFHEETARWPASLAELAPMFPAGVPRDPGSDNAFAYEPGVRIGPAGSGIQEVAFELQ